MASSASSRHEHLLVEFHEEMRRGEGDGERAHEIRERMDAVWSELDEAERRTMELLSEDLYVLEGKRRKPNAPSPAAGNLWEAVASAFADHRDEEALALMRQLPALETKHTFVFGRCWQRLGFLRAAVCFFDHAYEASRVSAHAVAALEALVELGDMDEAVARVDRIEKQLVAPPTLLLEAASVLHRAASRSSRVSEERRRSLFGRVIALVEHAWVDPTVIASLRASALMAAGFSHEHLGQADLALRAFERAALVYPKDLAQVAYGLALMKTDIRKANQQFTLAARARTPFAWVYLYAAKSALDEGRYAEAEQLCDTALQYAERPELRGRFHEWSAIAAARLGRPEAEVRNRFERALELLPLDPVLHRNVASFAEVSASNDWIVMAPPDTSHPTLLSLEPYDLRGPTYPLALAA